MWPCAFSWWVQELGLLESILEEGQERGGSEGLPFADPLGTQKKSVASPREAEGSDLQSLRVRQSSPSFDLPLLY